MPNPYIISKAQKSTVGTELFGTKYRVDKDSVFPIPPPVVFEISVMHRFQDSCVGSLERSRETKKGAKRIIRLAFLVPENFTVEVSGFSIQNVRGTKTPTVDFMESAVPSGFWDRCMRMLFCGRLPLFPPPGFHTTVQTPNIPTHPDPLTLFSLSLVSVCSPPYCHRALPRREALRPVLHLRGSRQEQLHMRAQDMGPSLPAAGRCVRARDGLEPLTVAHVTSKCRR